MRQRDYNTAYLEMLQDLRSDALEDGRRARNLGMDIIQCPYRTIHKRQLWEVGWRWTPVPDEMPQ